MPEGNLIKEINSLDNINIINKRAVLKNLIIIRKEFISQIACY